MTIELTVETEADRSERPYQFPLESDLVFGRGPESAVPLDGTALSREHFSLRADNGDVRVYDLSSNGTWHNGQRLGKGGSAAVASGSVIEIMGYRFVVRDIRAKRAAEPPPAPGKRVPAEPPPPPKPLLAPVSDFWNGFTGFEKTMLWVAAATAALLAAYLSSN
ncbi:MAG: FHA domain-containing protein [Bryobacteraceae bacterium]